MPFEALTNDKLEAARTGDWFLETNLAIAWIGQDDTVAAPVCVRRPFHREPDFGVTSVTYSLDELLG